MPSSFIPATFSSSILPWFCGTASYSWFVSSWVLLLVQLVYCLCSSLAFPIHPLSGDYSDAIETLLTAIAVIKQSRVANDERCRVLISSLKDCLHGIEAKSYSVGASGSSSRWVDDRFSSLPLLCSTLPGVGRGSKGAQSIWQGPGWKSRPSPHALKGKKLTKHLH